MSLSKISKKSFCSGASLPEEPDDVVRPAKIFLAKTDLLVNSGIAGAINHHALAILFEDDFLVIIEGNSFEGKLVPRYEKRDEYEASFYPLDKAHFPSNFWEALLPPLWLINIVKRVFLPRIFDIKISPRQLRDVARTNRHNFKTYALVKMDCQSWVLEASKEIQELCRRNGEYNV